MFMMKDKHLWPTVVWYVQVWMLECFEYSNSELHTIVVTKDCNNAGSTWSCSSTNGYANRSCFGIFPGWLFMTLMAWRKETAPVSGSFQTQSSTRPRGGVSQGCWQGVSDLLVYRYLLSYSPLGSAGQHQKTHRFPFLYIRRLCGRRCLCFPSYFHKCNTSGMPRGNVGGPFSYCQSDNTAQECMH